MNLHKGKQFLALLCVFLTCISLIGCGCQSKQQVVTEDLNKFSVNFIDVGDGDCILIKTPNGKHMLIDTGSQSTYENVKEKLTQLQVNNIDYLLLTNPTNDHVGAVQDLVNDFTVGLAYIPKILDLSLFTSFSKAKEALLNKNISTKISYQNQHILIDGCNIAFLSPSVEFDGAYSSLNSEFSPDKYQIGNVSPIVYCEYNSVRFLFTGDAYKSQENFVLDLYKNGVYRQVFSYYGLVVNLENIEFVKISACGDANATSKEFVDLIKPKNSVISVSSMNTECPSSTVLSRISGENANVGIYRTDVHGTISVQVEENGEYLIKTQK